MTTIRNIAHRGLWGGNIIENSVTAYKNAVENGYPIEIDLYLTTDLIPVSFHDETLNRMTGEKGKIHEKSLKELKALSLAGSDEKIPTFKEVLDVVNGKVPLLIELKNQPNGKIVDVVLDILKSYKGEYAIQSFNPLYIKRVKDLAPDILRGILVTKNPEDLKNQKPLVRYMLKNMTLNFLIKPHFISYDYNYLPVPRRKIKNRPVLAWTIKSEETRRKIAPYSDNIIFENFIPKE